VAYEGDPIGHALNAKGVKWKGFVIVRPLVDFDGKEKLFTFYPRKEHGEPPYLFKTRKKAEQEFAKEKADSIMKSMWDGAKVVKFKPEMYLDRY
jgi:hypothetical protein